MPPSCGCYDMNAASTSYPRSWRGGGQRTPVTAISQARACHASTRPDSAVDERPVVEVGLGQDLAFLLVLQHVSPRLAIALLEQDVLRAHDVASVKVLRIGERPQLHVSVLGGQPGNHHRGALLLH